MYYEQRTRRSNWQNRDNIRNALIGAAFPLTLIVIWNLKPFSPIEKAIIGIAVVFAWAVWFRLARPNAYARTVRFLAFRTASGPAPQQYQRGQYPAPQGQQHQCDQRPAPQGQQHQRSYPLLKNQQAEFEPDNYDMPEFQ